MTQEKPKLTQCPQCSNPVYESWGLCISCGKPINITKSTQSTEDKTKYDIPDFLKSVFKGRI